MIKTIKRDSIVALLAVIVGPKLAAVLAATLSQLCVN